MLKKVALFLFLIAGMFSPHLLFPLEAEEAHRYTLDNGLVVILRESHTLPLVAIQAWVNTGSIYEGEYLGTGISHFIEHMLFKSTARFPQGEVAKTIRTLGGEINGATSYEWTNYRIILPSEHFPKALEVLSDSLRNPLFEEKEMEKEREVILREMDMGEDNPAQLLNRLFWRTAFSAHPYRHPVIGYRSLFLKLTREDLFNYYRKRYLPNNTILVVCGDISEKEFLKEINKYFGDWERKPISPVFIPQEPRQLGPRRLIKEGDFQTARLLMGFHIPAIESEDVYPLDVIAVILGQGKSSRLVKEVREKRGLVYTITSWSYTPKYSGIFGIQARLTPDKLSSAIEAVQEEVNKIKNKAVGERELEKAKEQIAISLFQERESLEGEASDYALNEIIAGDFRFSTHYGERVKKVSPKDILRVARRYFTEENLTIVALVPKTEKEEIPSKPLTHQFQLQIQKYTFLNGLRLLVKEDHRLPLVYIRATFLGGIRAENEDNYGIFALLSRMLIRGSQKYSAEELAEMVEGAGGSISTYAGNNSFGIEITFPSSRLEEAIDILREVTISPVFPEEELSKVKEIVKGAIRAREDDIFSVGMNLFRKKFFPPHPFQFPPLGSIQSVERIRREDLIETHRKFCVPSNMVVSIFGDVQALKLFPEFERRFGEFPHSLPPEINPPPPQSREGEEVVEKVPKKETLILWGFPTVNLRSPERYAQEVLTAILSGQSSRLFKSLREERGLVYYVGAFSLLGLDTGAYIIYLGTSPGKVEEAIESIKREVELLVKEGISEEELEFARNNLLGNQAIKLQTNGAQAFQCALDELYGLGYDNINRYGQKIREVTREEVNRFIRNYLGGKRNLLVIVRP